MNNSNLINGVLKCLNPKMNVTPSHYICGSNLVLFTSLAQIENGLTCLTGNCKSFFHGNSVNFRLNEKN